MSIPAVSEHKFTGSWQDAEKWEEYERRKNEHKQVANTPEEYDEMNRRVLEELGL